MVMALRGQQVRATKAEIAPLRADMVAQAVAALARWVEMGPAIQVALVVVVFLLQ
jgi:hypothetical protein